MKVWCTVDSIIQNSHSGRLRAWAATHNVWVPGTVQKRCPIPGSYLVEFQPNPKFGAVIARIPGDSINIDSDVAKKTFGRGFPLSKYLELKEALNSCE